MINNIVGADVLSGGQSQSVSASTSSAQSTAISLPTGRTLGAPVDVVIVGTVAFFVRYGTNPTAVSDGTDQYWPAATPLRTQVATGGKFAFILPTGTGTIYITPGA